jgi:hypothetical protein
MRLANAVVALFDYPMDDILATLPEAGSPLWDVATFRQQRFDAHSVTRSIVFKWLDNRWRPGQPFIVMQAGSLPTELTTAVTACGSTLERHFGGKVAKLMFAELAAGAAVAPHQDGGALTFVHRCHLPIETNGNVSFYVDGEDFKLQPGIAYEFDNTRMHAVENRSVRRRVHLICDIMPPEYLA